MESVLGVALVGRILGWGSSVSFDGRSRMAGRRARLRAMGVVGLTLVLGGPAGRLTQIPPTALLRPAGTIRPGSPPSEVAGPKAGALPANPVARARPARQTRPSVPRLPNQIGTFRAESVSGRELAVTVDYSYGGDYGEQDIFLHAVALREEGWQSRVPGTSFPGAPVAVGKGRVTLRIVKVLESEETTSEHVKVCMVSIRKRSAFLCRTFEYAQRWDGPGPTEASAAEGEHGASQSD